MKTTEGLAGITQIVLRSRFPLGDFDSTDIESTVREVMPLLVGVTEGERLEVTLELMRRYCTIGGATKQEEYQDRRENTFKPY